MKKISKKLVIYITAIVLAIGFALPASVFAYVDTGAQVITIDYPGYVYIGQKGKAVNDTFYMSNGPRIHYYLQWYDAEDTSEPLADGFELQEGKTYKVVVSAWEYDVPGKWDLSDYSMELLQGNQQSFPYTEGTWEQTEASELRVTCECLVTPQKQPVLDLGAGTLDLSKGPVSVAWNSPMNMSIAGVMEFNMNAVVDDGRDENGNQYYILDLDEDGVGDIILTRGSTMTIAAYGNVSGKAPATVTFTEEELAYLGEMGSMMIPYYSTLTVIFAAESPAKTSIAKATVKGITAKAYTGKALKPTPKVALKGKTLKKGTDYTVTYKNNVNVGTATVVIKGKGNYSGTKTKTFKINPKGTSLKSVVKASKAVKVKWAKQSAKMKKSRITGYQILLATNSKFTKGKKTVNVAGYSKISKKVTGLKGDKKYYVKIRTYKKIGSTKYYSKWSGAKSVKTAK